MIHIERLVFNPFQENTYLIFDDTGACVVIDAGCHTTAEQEQLAACISDKKLKPVAQVYTHCHIDHILGMDFVAKTWNLPPLIHQAARPYLEQAPEQGQLFGLQIDFATPQHGPYLEEGDAIRFGNEKLEVLYTPGHAQGHICLVNRTAKFVLAGDVLFRGSIGRTDLPGGDFDVLASSIREKLFNLDKDFVVYPGHGPETSIAYEMLNNPFVHL